MIFCYTSTGNSYWAARRISKDLDETLYSVNAIAKGGYNACDYDFGENERLILAFPVHSWSVHMVMSTFLKKFHFTGKPVGVYALCTCGDDCGTTNAVVARMLLRLNLKLSACFSLTMPNDYVLMRGFEVDADAVRDQKLAAAVDQLDKIETRMRVGSTDAAGLYNPGRMAWLKTHLVNPLFRHFQCGHTPFHATDACVGCSLCSKVCPVNNIRMQDGKPQWRNHCMQCCACFHRCPQMAVQYGKVTDGKRQYLNPNVKLDD